jgi:hypothetical protein
MPAKKNYDMKTIKTFEEFVTESINTNLDLLEADTIFEEYDLLEEGWLKQIIGYTFFLPITLLNGLRQIISKKIKIKRMMNKETDPKKLDALADELRGLKYEEVKAKEKVEKQKEKMKKQAESMKSNATPEEKEKYKQQKEKMEKKLAKAEQDYRMSKLEFQGLF